MGRDDDIAASLPRPPLPAPARREASIEEALRRFDGGGELPPAPAGGRSAPRPAPWWTRPGRPYAGALASAFLVALIALPVAWMSLGEPVTDDGRDRRGSEVKEGTRPGPVIAAADANPSMSASASSPPLADSDAAAPPEARAVKDAAPIELAQTPPPPAPRVGRLAETGETADVVREARPADPGALAGSDVVVTGARITRPAIESASPITVVNAEREESSIVVTSARASSAKSAGRGDWNACTVDDPNHSLGNCRQLVDPAAKGVRGRAAAHVADGLARAWQGDVQGAIAAFDQAIEIAPRSSFIYLNRGLAWRRSGDLDRALADLDRAVLYAPRAARTYYNRSLVLRQRGDTRRARADADRAVYLDQSYADIVE